MVRFFLRSVYNINLWSGFQVDVEICPGKLYQSGDRILFCHITI